MYFQQVIYDFIKSVPIVVQISFFA